jgi:hypothetical protein
VHVALGLARLGYFAVGLAALAIGSGRWQAADSSAGLALLGGGLALAAAAWVTTHAVVRGALASIGIVVGAVLVAMTSFLAAAAVGMVAGDAPRAALLATPIPLAVAGAWIMWRASHRPWRRAPSD